MMYKESSAVHGDLLRWRLSRVLRHAHSSPGGLAPRHAGLAPRHGAVTVGSVTPADTATSFFTDLVADYHRHAHHVAEPGHAGDADLHGDAVNRLDDVKPSCRFTACHGRRSPPTTEATDGADDVKFSHSAQFLVSQHTPPTSYADQQLTSGSVWIAEAGPSHGSLVCSSGAVSATSSSMFCYCCSLDGATALHCSGSAGSVYPEPSSPGSSSTCWGDLDQYYARLNAADCWPRRLAPETGDDPTAAAAAAFFYSVNGFDLGTTFASPPQHGMCSTGATGGMASSREAGGRATRKTSAGSTAAVVGLGHSLQCAVCGDNAACQHYGVRTCEGCKGFFKVRIFTLRLTTIKQTLCRVLKQTQQITTKYG